MGLASCELTIRGLQLAFRREIRRALERGDARERGRPMFFPDRPELRLFILWLVSGHVQKTG